MNNVRFFTRMIVVCALLGACTCEDLRAEQELVKPIALSPITSYPALVVCAQDSVLLRGRLEAMDMQVSSRQNKIVMAWLTGGAAQRRAATDEFIRYWKSYARKWTPENLRRENPDGVAMRGLWRSIHLYDVVVSFGYLTTEQQREFRDALVAAVQYAIGEDYRRPLVTPRESFRHMNIWTDVVLAAGMTGLAFPELPQAPYWVGFAVHELQWQLESGEWDGAWHECPRYHAYMLKICSQFMESLYNRTGIDMFQMSAFKRMTYWFVRFGTPRDLVAGAVAGMPTGIVLTPGIGDTTWSTDNMVAIALFARHYAKSEPVLSARLMWLWHRMGSPYTSEPVLNMAVDPTLPQRAPSNLKSDINPIKGHLLMRDGFDTPDEKWMLIKCGRSSMSGHENGDCNSFSIFAFGYPLALDSGSGLYGDPNNKLWNKRSSAHNMVVFRNKGETDPYRYRTQHWRDGKIVSWISNDDIDYAVTDGSVPAAAEEHVRHVVFVKPDYFIIRDQIKSQYEPVWMLHTPATKLEWSARSVSCRTPWGVSLDVHSVMPNRDLVPNERNGQIGDWSTKSPEDRDFYDFKYQKYFEIAGSPSEDFVTLLYPRRDGDGGVQVSPLEDGVGVVVQIKGRKEIIRFLPDGISITRGKKAKEFKYMAAPNGGKHLWQDSVR